VNPKKPISEESKQLDVAGGAGMMSPIETIFSFDYDPI
jgi:hypothetical protein